MTKDQLQSEIFRLQAVTENRLRLFYETQSGLEYLIAQSQLRQLQQELTNANPNSNH